MTATDYEALPALAEEAPAPSAGTVVMKFGGTSVARRRPPEGRRPAARRRPRGRKPRRRGALRDGRHDRRARPARARDLAASEGARAGHADLGRRADLVLALRDGDPRPRPRGDLAHRLAGRDRHRHRARQGEDRRHPREPHPRGARRGADRARRRLPGRLDGPRHHDARPRRLGHDGRGARRSARRRRLRDLHGRGRRPHGRPADRPERAQAARGQLRRDAGDGRLGRARAPAAVGRVRAQPRCQAARPVELLGGRRHLDSRGGRTDAREGAHLRRHAQVGGDRVPGRGRRPPRSSSSALAEAGVNVDTVDPDRARRSSSPRTSAPETDGRARGASASSGRRATISAR